MSRVGALAAAGRSAVSKFHELRLKYWNVDLDVICCFEGSDDIEFFLPHVRDGLGLHPERIDFINCGGKGIVITLWDWAAQRSWNKARIGFFVDRDLDDFLGGNPTGDQLYVTDHYSIESHVLDDGFFDSVWQDLFRLPLTDARRSFWKSLYYEGMVVLAKVILPISYLAVAYKRRGEGVDFSRVQLAELVAVTENGNVVCKSGTRMIDYSTIFMGAAPPLSEIRAARREILMADKKLWLRGKYVIWFAMLFFSRMKSVLGRRTEPNRAVVKTAFNAETAMTCLCGRAALPASLRAFLSAWASLIVRNGVIPAGAAM